MKARLKNIFIAMVFMFGIASPVMAITVPQTASAAAACEGRFLGIPPWYRGLTGSAPECAIISPDQAGGLSTFIWKIVLNVVEMAIIAATYVTVFFILYGGFLFMTGGAHPGQIEKGRKTLLNAVIGFVICLASIAITNLVFSII